MKSRRLNFNETKALIMILIFLSGFFIMREVSWAKDEDIIITEVMYNPIEGGGDWFEIFNNSNEDINLKNLYLVDEFKLEKNICHGVNKDDFIFKAGGYIVIGKGSFDFIVNSLDLNGVNEDAVRLSWDNCKTFFSELIYDPKKIKTERGYSFELDNETGLFRESVNKGGSPGEKNPEREDKEDIEDDYGEGYIGSVRINELLPNPKGNDSEGEFIELYNYGDKSIDLEKWKVMDKSGKTFNLVGILEAKNYIIFCKTVSLNNDSDEISLKNPNNEIIDSVSYEKSQENFSYSFNEKRGRWEWSSVITPGKENKFNEDSVNGEEKYDTKIRFNEILPNPKGSDAEEEYIELYNFGKDEIDLGEGDGWILEDKVGTEEGKYKKLYFIKYPKEKIVKPNDFLVIKRETGFNFALSNSDEVVLRDPRGSQVDRIAYSGAKEGVSYNFDEKINKWRWSEFLTPGLKNEFKEVGEIKIKIDEDIYKDVYANFEVSMVGVKDKDLKAKWEFGDEKNSYKAKTRHKYVKNGKYVVKLRVSGSSEDINREFNIKVEDFPERKVSILSINPNPQGKDEEGEWIELKNKSKKKVNLKNWSIATGSSKKKLTNHPIKEDFIIKAGKIKQITREVSKFSLNNKKGYIELRYPDGEVAYKLKYEKEKGVDEDEIYRKKEGGGWEWLKNKNIIMGEDKDEKEDSLEVVEIEVIKDIDLIRDMTPEDKGKYSERRRDNLVESCVKNELIIAKKDENNISMNLVQVLGAWDNKNKKIREEEGFYYFNPKGKEEKHYMLVFFENVLGKI